MYYFASNNAHNPFLACVNIVRWSCEGHLLASGGDDKLVMIWKLTGEGSSSIFGGGGKVLYTINIITEGLTKN